MTDTEQDRDLDDARSYLSVTTVTVDRCRHETVDRTSLWFFIDGEQIASASRMPAESRSDYRWEVSRMAQGLPVSRRAYATLLEVVGDVMRYEPRR
jgi:hypothetical protein